MHRKLDSAMVAFLDCLRQLGDSAEANLKLPYKYPPGWVAADSRIKSVFSNFGFIGFIGSD
jgi:hypothetical protein